MQIWVWYKHRSARDALSHPAAPVTAQPSTEGTELGVSFPQHLLQGPPAHSTRKDESEITPLCPTSQPKSHKVIIASASGVKRKKEWLTCKMRKQ